jgi:hypothetical protein
VKPLAFKGGKRQDPLGLRKPLVKVNGRRMLYVITLRPLFFRASTAKTRIGTLLHELFHISRSFDGTLDQKRRHSSLGAEFAKRLRPLVRRYLKQCSRELREPFGHNGEVRIYHWLERPSTVYVPGRSQVRRVYTEEQLFLGSVRMITKKAKPRVGPKLH